MEFNTITISDGITMGTEGMKASLISREVIADSIELVTRGNSFDGLVCIAGCDKNMPAAIMALARLDIPGLMLYGGCIAPGHLHSPTASPTAPPRETSPSSRSSKPWARTPPARSTTPSSKPLEAAACPGPGACGGQFTANTMAMAGEFLGISPIQLTGVPAMSPEKHEACRAAGRIVMDLARTGLKPSQDHHPQVHRERHRRRRASGGSTNAVLHLIAIASELDIPLTMEDFDRICEHTPFICDLSPGGKYVAKDYQDAGGSRVLAKRLLDKGLLHGNTPTVSGKTLREEAAAAVETPGQPVIHTWDKPLKPTGGLVILKGNLAPEGCVIKVAGHERIHHTGTARVFDTEDDCLPPSKPARSTPTTCSSSATKAPAAAPACARCSPSPPPSKASPNSPKPSPS